MEHDIYRKILTDCVLQWRTLTICLKSFCWLPNSQNVNLLNSTKVETFCEQSYTCSHNIKHNTSTIFATNTPTTLHSSPFLSLTHTTLHPLHIHLHKNTLTHTSAHTCYSHPLLHSCTHKCINKGHTRSIWQPLFRCIETRQTAFTISVLSSTFWRKTCRCQCHEKIPFSLSTSNVRVLILTFKQGPMLLTLSPP